MLQAARVQGGRLRLASIRVPAYANEIADDVVEPSRTVGTIEIPLELYKELGSPEQFEVEILRGPRSEAIGMVVLRMEEGWGLGDPSAGCADCGAKGVRLRPVMGLGPAPGALLCVGCFVVRVRARDAGGG